MGVNIPETILRLGHRAHFVHFRDVIGKVSPWGLDFCARCVCMFVKHTVVLIDSLFLSQADDFVETFQDEGQTDMQAALESWKKVGFNGIIRPDHVPLLPDWEEAHAEGEKAAGYFSGLASGYTMVRKMGERG